MDATVKPWHDQEERWEREQQERTTLPAARLSDVLEVDNIEDWTAGPCSANAL
jgi:hypothetical protein